MRKYDFVTCSICKRKYSVRRDFKRRKEKLGKPIICSDCRAPWARKEVPYSDGELQRMYINDEMSLSKIGTLVGLSYSSVKKRLAHMGTQIRPSPPALAGHIGRQDIPLDEKTLRRLYYDEYLSLKKIASHYGVTRPVINRLLKEYKISKREHRAKKYRLDDSFFSILNQDSSYVLGVICADGCLHGGSTVTITSKDGNWLKQIADIMLFHPIPIRRCSTEWTDELYVLRICSARIYSDLTRLGLTPRKSLTLTFPGIPSELLGDFIRGFFDGDGCVWLHKKYGLRVEFACGSIDFIVPLEKHLRKHGITPKSPKLYKSKLSVHGAYIIKYAARKDMPLIYELMYGKSCNLFLGRKKAIFDSCL